MRKYQHHIYILAGIIIGVVIVFYFSGALEKPAPPPEPGAPIVEHRIAQYAYNVLIHQANWGMNCADAIQRKRSALKEEMRFAIGSEYEALQEEFSALPDVPTLGNATEKVSEHCQIQPTCTIEPAGSLFESEGAASCIFNLEVAYRCFSLDRLRREQSSAFDNIRLDCSELNEQLSTDAENNE